MPVWLKNGKLSGSIETVKGRFNWQSALKLESNRFYRIRIVYDLEKLEVYVDDKPAASVPAAGNLSDGWILCIGGAPFKTAAAVSNVLAKTGQAHNQPNSGFNFSGTLKRLKISNCPLRSR